ncbi:glycosyltransferase involved in cell wall biosynthesis [Paenibacillus shirakamiensis]|uniref:Glycosyltransferase involved in cell wall biosynthesis n=1 Tax=Paenibacillus shirakamiensis TaxID=1265935 RepID=A0ABS4JLD3_9BACL|nr:glycosyltransferase family A protein [Paenibacillus shirakamiensis]MBP2002527.1 glycosyltransferase involved in cell wall biosynthesis [Paenibacillus shirakamiensis]
MLYSHIQPKVSIIFAIKNEGLNVLTTLESLKVSLTLLPFEVIIVDDQSIDSCCEFLFGYKFPTPIHYVKTAGAGPAEARNIGAARAKGEILIFCSAYMYFNDYWMDQLAEPILERRVDCTSPSISLYNAQGRIGYGQKLILPEMRTEWILESLDSASAAIMPWECIAVGQSAYQNAQGFEEGFKEGPAIAAEFSLRMRLLGFSCSIAPDVNVQLMKRTLFPYIAPEDCSGYHLLRMAYMHFNEERLAKSRDAISTPEDVHMWETQILEEGVLEQRERYLASRQFDDTWFFERYHIYF